MNERQEAQFFNFINLLAFALGWENLQENRQQSRYNDVQAANDRQAEYLLAELSKKFDEQNRILEEQNKMLDKLLKAISDLE